MDLRSATRRDSACMVNQGCLPCVPLNCPSLLHMLRQLAWQRVPSSVIPVLLRSLALLRVLGPTGQENSTASAEHYRLFRAASQFLPSPSGPRGGRGGHAPARRPAVRRHCDAP
ncbi:unnamed protein product [Prorocentrum cordatum]|uniref:Uncharacterized protein n=1 Tax=Prorocentrum cordatum TaxID=2364126 RepID=A0ABN9R2W0_9DINO|nr:unnamed protein product [Polarella glacialis]